MRIVRNRGGDVRAGYTLLEVMIALSIFLVLGYAMMSALAVSSGTQGAVEDASRSGRTLRRLSAELSNEFRLTRDDSIVVTVLPDQNHRVTFQLPILDAGAAAWGVPSSYFGSAQVADAVGWSLRYTVDAVLEHGAVNRRLVRQVLDAAGIVQDQRVVAELLRAGDDVWPGFNVVQTGVVWNITLSMTGGTGGKTELHVATRN